MMIEAYPLYWPEGRPRTPRSRRETARFDTSFGRARDSVVREIEMLTGRYERMRKEANIIVSTNVALRRDGLPSASQKTPDDVGVAVYFNYKKKPVCFACDRWNQLADNMQAIAKTIEALRGIARWGTGDMMEAAFTGFVALPAPGQTTARGWRDVLELEPEADLKAASGNYRRLASKHHPDRPGGSQDRMTELNAAWEQAQAALGGA